MFNSRSLFVTQLNLFRDDPFGPNDKSPQFSAGYSGNGGGPQVYGRLSETTGRASTTADFGGEVFTSIFQAGNKLSQDPGGTRLYGQSRTVLRAGSQAGIYLNLAHTSGEDIRYPLQNGILDSDSDTRMSLGARSRLTGLASYVTADITMDRVRADWRYAIAAPVPVERVEDFARDVVRGKSELGFGSSATLFAEAYARSVTSFSTVDQGSAQTSATLLDARESGGRVSARFAPSMDNVDPVVQAGLGFSKATDGLNSGVSARTLVADLKAGVHTGLTRVWSILGTVSFEKLPTPVELRFSNGLRANFGQLNRQVVGDKTDSQSVVAVAGSLFGKTRLAELEFSSSVSFVENGFTPSVTDSTNLAVGIIPADLLYAEFYTRSTSAFRNLASFEIDIRGRLGRNRTLGEPAPGVTPWAIGSHLVLRTPSGRTYASASTISFLRKNSVAGRLGELPTPGAFIADLSLGYSRGEMSYEIFVRNVFDKTYWYHTGPVRFVDDQRLPAKGRNLGFRLTITPGR